MEQELDQPHNRSENGKGPFVILQKPLVGDPCNRCGHCCRTEACPAAKSLWVLFDGQCAALETDENGRTSCGLVDQPMKYIHHSNMLALFSQGTSAQRIAGSRALADKIRTDLGMVGVCDSIGISDIALGYTIETGRERWKAAARALGFQVAD